MTIKVVKRGTPPADVVYEATCSGYDGCGSSLEYNRGDVASGGDQRDSWYVLVCPVCHTHIHLSTLTKKRTDSVGSTSWVDR